MKQQLWISFSLAFFASLFFSALFPPVHWIYYAPFLILALNHFSLKTCLWLSFLSGLLIDLFSTSFFASSAINYLCATLCFYPGRKLFNEKPISLSLSTLLYSFYFALIEFCLYFLFRKRIDPLLALFSIFFTIPLFNALYSSVWFIAPLKGIEMAKDFWKKRKVSDE